MSSPLFSKITHHHFDTLDSTNAWAKRNLHTFESGVLTLICASEQTGGRGRFARPWVSPPGINLYLTFHFSTSKPSHELANTTQVGAVAVASLLEKVGIEPQMKWPNDLYVCDRKIAGLLTEVVTYEGRRHVLMGIGLNVNMSKEELQEVGQPATSILLETAQEWPLDQVLDQLTNEVVRLLTEYLAEGFPAVFNRYLELSASQIGKSILVKNGGRLVGGSVVRIESDGTLLLKVEEGGAEPRLVRIASGEQKER